LIELTQKCRRCDGSGKEISGDGTEQRMCPECKYLGRVLDDEVGGFIHALLRDDEIYYRVREMAKKLKADLNKS
jgi:hypothetical protein